MNRNLKILLLLFAPLLLTAQQGYSIFKGIVTDSETKESLPYVHIAWSGSQYGTVGNEEGHFQIKIPDSNMGDTMIFSFMGYEPYHLTITKKLTKNQHLHIKLQPATQQLSLIEVRPIDEREIMRAVVKNIRKNYEIKPFLQKGFFRERGIREDTDEEFLFAEGVIMAHKDKYVKGTGSDYVSLIKGYRKKLQYDLIVDGQLYELPQITQGAYIGVRLDIVRDPGFFLSVNKYIDYNFEYERSDILNGNEIYVIRFYPKEEASRAWLKGYLFIEKERLAVVKAEYEYTEKAKAYYNRLETAEILQLEERRFEMNYFQYQGKWFLQNAHVKSKYTESRTLIPLSVNMDFVATAVETNIGRNGNIPDIKGIIRFDRAFAFNERLEKVDDDFWGSNNILEQTQQSDIIEMQKVDSSLFSINIETAPIPQTEVEEMQMETIVYEGGKPIPPNKLKKDFDQLTSMIEAHPAPYRHISEKEMNALIDSTRNLLDEPMDAISFFKLVSPIYSAIKDGHTSMRISSVWLYDYLKEYGRFPYKVYLSDENRLYVIRNWGRDSTIELGSEILALNGTPTATFVEEISRYISYEQEIFRNTIIEYDFDLYLLLYFGKIKEISVDYLSDKEHQHVVGFVSYNDWKEALDEEEKIERELIAGNRDIYEYIKIREDVGLLKIHSFGIGKLSEYDAFLRKMFRRIRKDKVRSLIIDVRGNTGGYPKVVSELLHCVSEKHFKTMARSEMKVSQAYKDYFSAVAPSVDLYSSKVRFLNPLHSVDLSALFSNENGSFVTEERVFNEPPKETYNEFTGDLYLLTDRRSFSASSSFAATFRCYQLGLIIGSETGGTRVFHANSMYKKLPHSGISCGMATTRLYTSCFYEEDEGIKPDLEVKPTVQELVAKRDAVLDYTLRVIDKVKKIRKG